MLQSDRYLMRVAKFRNHLTMRKYRLVAKKGEGTFSEVLKAQNVHDHRFVAIKCMKSHFDSIDQVNNLREIQALRRLSPHAHIVALEEVLYDQKSGRLALVFELMDVNLYEMVRGRKHYLKASRVQSLLHQLLSAMDHMHSKGIFHRDIKPENILVGESSELKLADFGSCRGIYSKQPYTEYISTRW
jgi:renal tumor antigen